MYDFNLAHFVKVPGYIPLSELPEVLDMEGDSVVMRIGTLDDGTPLFEVFRRKEMALCPPDDIPNCKDNHYAIWPPESDGSLAPEQTPSSSSEPLADFGSVSDAQPLQASE